MKENTKKRKILASSGNYRDDCGIWLVVVEIDRDARLRPEGVYFSATQTEWIEIDKAIKKENIECKYFGPPKEKTAA